MVRQAVPAWVTKRPIAHRGLHDLSQGIPENSLAAFERASKLGFPVELDVHLTRDGKVVVIHDNNLDRITGMKAAVEATDYDVLARLRLKDSDQRIPTLAEVLDLLSGNVPMVIEIKSANRTNDLEEKVLELVRSRDREVAIVSFNPISLKYFKEMAPDILRGQNSGLFRTGDLDSVELNYITRLALRSMLLNRLSRPAFISYQLEGISSLPVSVCRRLGIPVLAWTVRSPQDQERAREHADNIIFEGFIPETAIS